MSEETGVALAAVCRVLGAPRSTVYARAGARAGSGAKRGPRTALSDAELTEAIEQTIKGSPFSGEGHRKVTARLRRERGIRVGRKRVLRLMREAGLLAPQRARGRRRPRPHDGRIIPEAPDLMWGTDATMAWALRDGWVWAFVTVDHFTAEAWARSQDGASVSPRWSRSTTRRGIAPAPSGPMSPAGSAAATTGDPDTPPRFQGSLRWLGIEDSPAYVGEPPCNGCAGRFIRTLKEQVIWARRWDTIEELAAAVRAFVELYKGEWLIERHGHRAPREAYEAAIKAAAA